MTLNPSFWNYKDETIDILDPVDECFTMDPREVTQDLRNRLESKE